MILFTEILAILLAISLLEQVLSTSGAKARTLSNRDFCIWFWSTSAAYNIIRSKPLGLILPTPAAKDTNSSNLDLRDWFCRLLEPRPEKTSNQDWFLWTSGAKARKVIKSKLRGFIFSRSCARASKALNQDFWDWFYRLLEPRPQSHQIETSGKDFVDFWTQGQKMLKSEVLGPFFSAFGPKAGKC